MRMLNSGTVLAHPVLILEVDGAEVGGQNSLHTVPNLVGGDVGMYVGVERLLAGCSD